MGKAASIKSLVGPSNIRTIISAAALNVPESGSVFFVSGTTGITSINSGPVQAGRLIELVGLDNSTTSIVITGVAIATAVSGQPCLDTADITISRGDSIRFRQGSTGKWIERGRSNGIA